jgi:hypothetical protein
MLKYGKVIDHEKGICYVGLGTDEEFYKSIGMGLLDVEQAYDGNWYLTGKAPAPPEMRTVRTFSKFGIWVATRNLPIAEGSEVMVWDAFEKFLHEQNLWAGWNQLIDLVEDNPFFEQFYPIAVEAFGKELVDNVLEMSVSKVEHKTKEGF